MPRRKPPAQPVGPAPLPLTPSLFARLRDLEPEPTERDAECPVCHQGRGIDKVALNDGRLLCVPCLWTLRSVRRHQRRMALDGVAPEMSWQELRLPHFRRWMTGYDSEGV